MAQRRPRVRLVWALVVWAGVCAKLTVWAALLARPDGWFDRTPAQLRAHAAQCADIGTGGARMVGCRVQLGTQPAECVYVPEKAADPGAALRFLGLRKEKVNNPPAGRVHSAQLKAMPAGQMGCVWVLKGANDH